MTIVHSGLKELTIQIKKIVHILAKLGQENLLRMVRWVRWHCPPDTRFEIRAQAGNAISRSRRLPTILCFTSGRGRNILVSFKLPTNRGPGEENLILNTFRPNCNKDQIFFSYEPPETWIHSQIISGGPVNCIILLLKPEFIIVIFIHYKPRIAVAILDL